MARAAFGKRPALADAPDSVSMRNPPSRQIVGPGRPDPPTGFTYVSSATLTTEPHSSQKTRIIEKKFAFLILPVIPGASRLVGIKAELVYLLRARQQFV